MTIKATEAEQETQSDFDHDAAQAEISSELFGQGKEEEVVADKPIEGEQEKPSGEPSPDAVEPAPQPVEGEVQPEVVPDENAAAVQEIGAPKTWTKEALETWATIPPRAQQEILKREEDFMNGITQYKTAADVGMAYSKVVEPYAPILAAEGVDPVQLFQSFSANHYLLTRGTPQQKIELAASLLSGYEIPLPDLLNYMADRMDAEPTPPVVAALQREVGELKNYIQTAQTSQRQAVTTQLEQEIEAFANDPAHPYFKELAGDIGKLFEAGLATNLQEAYEKAVYANPTTRQKEIERLTAEKQSAAEAEEQKRKDKVARSTADQVILTPKSRDGTVPVGSIDDTLEETMAAIQSRG